LERNSRIIGPQCSAQAREAIKLLTSGDTRDLNEMLLGDIAMILTDPTILVGNTGDPKNPPKPIGSATTLRCCCRSPTPLTTRSSQAISVICWCNTSPHREAYAGLTQAKVASMLRVFDIKPEPGRKRRGEQVLCWYRRDRFDPWFLRYGFIDSAGEPVMVDDLPEGAIDGAHVEDVARGVSARHEEVPRSSVADNPEPQGVSTEPTEPPLTGSVMAAPVERSTLSEGATPLHAVPEIVYANAHVVEDGKGDKKRAKLLRWAIDALVMEGMVDPALVSFTCARFWVISRDGQRYFFHNDGDSLEWCKRNIEMTPLCKVEVTLPRVQGSREVRRGGGVDEQAGVQPS
jgi:hypothetical protein